MKINSIFKSIYDFFKPISFKRMWLSFKPLPKSNFGRKDKYNLKKCGKCTNRCIWCKRPMTMDEYEKIKQEVLNYKF